MGKLIAHLALTLAFFTRIPLPKILAERISEDERLADATALFSITGFLIAIIPALIWYVSSSVLPAAVAAGLAIVAGILITGALHEDGLADCADGLGGAGTRERALKIMRDSRIGTYGGLALVLSVGLRWAALSALAPISGLIAILICGCGSRAAMTIAMQYSNYARDEGLGAQAEGIPEFSFLIAVGIAAAIAIVFGGFAGACALGLGLVGAWAFLKYLEARLGGYTGDGLGATQQICEIVMLLTLAGFWA